MSVTMGPGKDVHLHTRCHGTHNPAIFKRFGKFWNPVTWLHTLTRIYTCIWHENVSLSFWGAMTRVIFKAFLSHFWQTCLQLPAPFDGLWPSSNSGVGTSYFHNSFLGKENPWQQHLPVLELMCQSILNGIPGPGPGNCKRKPSIHHYWNSAEIKWINSLRQTVFLMVSMVLDPVLQEGNWKTQKSSNLQVRRWTS